MAVISVNIGERRVQVTARCPTDDLGLLACTYVLLRVEELLGMGVTSAEMRDYLVARLPACAAVFDHLAAGGMLPQYPAGTIDPLNAEAELHILQHLQREAGWQRRD